MDNTSKTPIRSPSYPGMSLENAVDAVGKIEKLYRSAPVDRGNAAKLIGYQSLSGPANKALAALASYGLVERAGKGQMRVTGRAQAILHPKDEKERLEHLRAAAVEPRLFQEIQDHFQGIVPPAEGVNTYLARQGFNDTAIKPATKAFLETMKFLEESGVIESHGLQSSCAPNYEQPEDEQDTKFGGAKVGDLVQWESQGVLRLEKPTRVRIVSEDGQWVAVEGRETGIPMNEVIVEQGTAEGHVQPPVFPIQSSSVSDEDDAPYATDLRFKVGKSIVVKVISPDELGVDELNRLIKLLEAQSAALSD